MKHSIWLCRELYRCLNGLHRHKKRKHGKLFEHIYALFVDERVLRIQFWISCWQVDSVSWFNSDLLANSLISILIYLIYPGRRNSPHYIMCKYAWKTFIQIYVYAHTLWWWLPDVSSCFCCRQLVSKWHIQQMPCFFMIVP